MSYKLEQPYTDKQRADFIVLHNHQNGRKIEEGVNGELFALEPYEKLVDGEVIDNTQEYEQEQARKEAERIAMLNLTAADVERAIYKAKGLDFNDVISLVEKQKATIDIKALQIELKANNFYRGNPYIDAVGTILGFTKEQLDKFFDTNDYRYLTTCKLKVNAIPKEAVIEINSEIQSEITVPYGSTVDIVVSCEGYISRKDVLTLTEDRTLEVVRLIQQKKLTQITLDNGSKLLVRETPDYKLQSLYDKAGEWLRSKLSYYKGKQIIKTLTSENGGYDG